VFDVFLQFFPACLLFVWIVFRTVEEWGKEDRETRRALAGRALLIDGSWRILQEDGKPLADIDIATYFDELPCVRWDGRRDPAPTEAKP
jgi:hypothetical protein